jgi:hypothetical protein
MLPIPTDTARLRELSAIVCASTSEELSNWPMLTEKDYLLIGVVVVLYSYIDLNLRRIIEAFHHAGKLGEPWSKHPETLHSDKVAEAIFSLPCWNEGELFQLKEVENLRGLRNLVAHFAPRRFPANDAFLFITKSAKDFKRVYGRFPEPGGVMTAIVEREQIRDAVKFIEAVQNWLARATSQLEADLFPF